MIATPRSALVLLLVAAAAGCDSGRAIDVDVDPACLASATTLVVDVTFAPNTPPLTHRFPAREFFAQGHRFGVVLPDSLNTSTVRIHVVALASTVILGDQTVDVPVTVGITRVHLSLLGCGSDGPLADGGVPVDAGGAPDGSAPDLSAADATVRIDGAAPPLCQSVTVTTLAGDGNAGFVNGSTGATTQFSQPTGIAADAMGVYVAEAGNHAIRWIHLDGSTSTVAGKGTPGFADGPSSAALFRAPEGIRIDGARDLYVADTGNNRVRVVGLQSGMTSTLLGNGMSGDVEGTTGPNGTAELVTPVDVALDAQHDVYVSDYGANRIRVLHAASTVTTTLAGNGGGYLDGTGGRNGTTQFLSPWGIDVDGGLRVTVVDSGNHRVRRVDGAGTTITVTGNGAVGHVDGTGGPSGTTELVRPAFVVLDPAGNAYVSDVFDHSIRKVAFDGTTVTVAGTGVPGYADGPGCTAQLHTPSGLALRGKLLLVADGNNHRVRQIQLP